MSVPHTITIINDEIGEFSWTPPTAMQRVLDQLTMQQLDTTRQLLMSDVLSFLLVEHIAVIAGPKAPLILSDIGETLKGLKLRTVQTIQGPAQNL